LSISKSLSEMMGGSITVESKQGQGSTFIVQINLEQEPKLIEIHSTLHRKILQFSLEPRKTIETNQKQPALYNQNDLAVIQILKELSVKQPPQEWFLFSGWSSVPTFLTQKRILIVEDNLELRYLVEKYCLEWGFQVDSVATGEEALSLLRSSAQAGNPYAIGLIDLTLPRMDGWQLASEINSTESINGVKLILMSPRGTGTMEAKMKLLHWFEAYLGKPIKKLELYSSIIDCLTVEGELEVVEEIPEPSSHTETIHNLEPILEKSKSYSQQSEFLGTSVETVGTEHSKNAPIEAKQDHSRSFQGVRVLVAEDHEVNRTLFETILKSMGVEVTTVENGALAVEMAGKSNYDLIFMDVHMPVLNGYEATKKIRDRAIKIPIIAATANAIKGEQEKCIAVGMDGFLSKPFRKKDVVASLQQWLSAKPNQSLGTTEHLNSGLLKHMLKNPVAQDKDPGNEQIVTNITPVHLDHNSKVIDEQAPVSAMEDEAQESENQNEGQSMKKTTQTYQSVDPINKELITDPNDAPDYRGLLVFDPEELMDTFMNQRETVNKVLAGYVERAKSQILAIRKAVADGDADALRQEAHGLKGASLSISAEMLGAVTKDLELAGMEGDLGTAKALVALLPRTFRILEQKIEIFLQEG